MLNTAHEEQSDTGDDHIQHPCTSPESMLKCGRGKKGAYST